MQQPVPKVQAVASFYASRPCIMCNIMLLWVQASCNQHKPCSGLRSSLDESGQLLSSWYILAGAQIGRGQTHASSCPSPWQAHPKASQACKPTSLHPWMVRPWTTYCLPSAWSSSSYATLCCAPKVLQEVTDPGCKAQSDTPRMARSLIAHHLHSMWAVPSLGVVLFTKPWTSRLACIMRAIQHAIYKPPLAAEENFNAKFSTQCLAWCISFALQILFCLSPNCAKLCVLVYTPSSVLHTTGLIVFSGLRWSSCQLLPLLFVFLASYCFYSSSSLLAMVIAVYPEPQMPWLSKTCRKQTVLTAACHVKILESAKPYKCCGRPTKTLVLRSMLL